MQRTRAVGPLLFAATVLVAAPLFAPASAEAHGRHGGLVVGVGGFYGWGPYWGWGAPYGGWGWGWGWPTPYYFGYGAPGGSILGAAMMAGMGGLDLNVKPNEAEAWVDGRYVADARDLDGNPSYLWLKAGSHHLVLYKAGFRSFDGDVDVHVGMMQELKVRLEKGESKPPTPAAAPPEPAAAPPEPRRPESPEPPAAGFEAPRAPTGGVRLQVEPRDATVYVDGEYRGSARELPDLRLAAGHHRVEVVRPGFQPLEKEIDVEADRTTVLELSMERSGGWKY
jgi:hypothetical protein